VDANALQHVCDYTSKNEYAFHFAPSAIGKVTALTRVIEYYVPEKVRKLSERWIPPKQRGKIIPFPPQASIRQRLATLSWRLLARSQSLFCGAVWCTANHLPIAGAFETPTATGKLK